MLTWKLACRYALSNDVVRRSLFVALIIGTVLNVINQGDAFLGTISVNWFKIALTYCVPYAVYTFGAISAHLKHTVGS